MPESYGLSQVKTAPERLGFVFVGASDHLLVMADGEGFADPPMLVLPVLRGVILADDLAYHPARLGENPEPYFSELESLG